MDKLSRFSLLSISLAFILILSGCTPETRYVNQTILSTQTVVTEHTVTQNNVSTLTLPAVTETVTSTEPSQFIIITSTIGDGSQQTITTTKTVTITEKTTLTTTTSSGTTTTSSTTTSGTTTSMTTSTTTESNFVASKSNTEFQYDLYSKHIEITKYIGAATQVEIPATIDDLPVTTIKSIAFNNCDKMISINIPDSVTNIESAAFYGCTSLTSIIIPNSVTSIERSDIGCQKWTPNLSYCQ